MKVLLITYYWPPAGGSGVQRWLKFVKYLPDFGVEPVVYTVEYPNYAIKDPSLMQEVPDQIEVIKGSIREPSTLLSLLGKDKKERSAGFLNQNPSFIDKQLRYIRANYFIPDARKFWIKPSVKLLSAYLEKNKIDIVITTGPPHSLHLIGLELKKRYGLKWVSDFRDPWTNIDYFHSLPLTDKSRRQHQQLENTVLQNSDAVIVVGKSMKEEFNDRNKHIELITNGYDDMEISNDTDLDIKFSISHIGMMNADRNPIALWEALKELIAESKDFSRGLSVQLIGKCAPEVYSSIAACGLGDQVSFVGYMAHKEVLKYQLASQLLLLCVNKVPSAKSLVTGKVFEYLQSRRPIIGIGPVDGDLAEILRDTNAGVMIDFDDKKKMKQTIKALYKDYKLEKLAVKSKHIEQYHRRNLTKKLAAMLMKI